MITLAMFTLNLFHPGFLLSSPPANASSKELDGEISGTEVDRREREKEGRTSEETA